MNYLRLKLLLFCLIAAHLVGPEPCRGQTESMLYATGGFALQSMTLDADHVDIKGPYVEHGQLYYCNATEFDPSTNRIYGVDFVGLNRILVIDMATGEFGTTVPLKGEFFDARPILNEQDSYGISRDPTTGEFYLTTQNRLFRLNVLNGQTTRIGEYSGTSSNGEEFPAASDIAIDNGGNMYAVDFRESLWRIDKNSASATYIGPITSGGAFSGPVWNSIDFDSDTNELYGLFTPIEFAQGSYGTIDTDTAIFTELSSLNDFPMRPILASLTIGSGNAYVISRPGTGFFGSGHFSTFDVDDVSNYTTLLTIENHYIQATDFNADGSVLYASTSFGNEYVWGTIDLETGQFVPITLLPDDFWKHRTWSPVGLAFDYATDRFYLATGRELFTVDEGGQTTFIGKIVDDMLPLRVLAIAVSSNGTMYAIGKDYDTDEEQLWTIDKSTGSISQVSRVCGDECTFNYTVGLDFDPISNVLYLSLSDAYGTLDPITAEFTNIAPNPNFRKLAIRPPMAFNDIHPNQLSINSGQYSGGFIHSLKESDNSDFMFQRDASQLSGRIELEMSAVSPIASPTVLEFTWESGAFVRSNVCQTIELFDFDSGEFVVVDSRNASRFADSTVAIQPPDPLERFIEPVTGQMRARVKYTSSARRQAFSVGVDQAAWFIE